MYLKLHWEALGWWVSDRRLHVNGVQGIEDGSSPPCELECPRQPPWLVLMKGQDGRGTEPGTGEPDQPEPNLLEDGRGTNV